MRLRFVAEIWPDSPALSLAIFGDGNCRRSEDVLPGVTIAQMRLAAREPDTSLAAGMTLLVIARLGARRELAPMIAEWLGTRLALASAEHIAIDWQPVTLQADVLEKAILRALAQ